MNADALIPLVESMELIGYALPSPEQMEFTLAPASCDLYVLPPVVKEDVLSRLTPESLVLRMVTTELGTHGSGIGVAVIIPPKGGVVAATEDRD